jgi:hypothetical protein
MNMIAPGVFDFFCRFNRNFRRSRIFAKLSNCALLFCALAALTFAVSGQSNVSGRFFGVVRDSATQTVIPGATATFKNLRTGSLTTARAGDDGQFSYTPLSPDDYEIEVKADGYLPQMQRQTLTAMQPTPVEPIPFELIKTTAALPTPDPTQPNNPQATPTPAPVAATSDNETINLNPSRGAAFDIRMVQGLPLGGTTLTRTFDELAFLVPGVNPPPQAIGNTVGPGVGGGVGTSGQFSVNGLRSRANNFTVDGSDNNDEDIGVRRQGFFSLVPQPIESIQEFQIITLLAPAQYGRNLGAQVNAISKGGGNEFHGAIYGMGNADFLNARNFFDNAGGNMTTPLTARRLNGTVIPVRLDDQPVQVTNDAGRKDAFSILQGGFAVGGPIVRNKAFFFGSGEYQHLDGTSERHFAVPTVEQRGVIGSGAQGFFGNSCTSVVGGVCVTLFYPIFPTAFVGEAVFSLFPFPNDPSGVYGRNTFTRSLPIDARGLILSGKADWNVFTINGRQQTLTGRYNFTDDKRDLTDVGGALFSAIRPLVRTDNISTYLTGGLTNSISNEFRFSYGRTRLRFDELRDPLMLPIESLDAGEDTRFLLNARYISNNTIPTCPAGRTPCPQSTLTFSPFVNYQVSRQVDEINGDTTENSDLGPVGQVIISGFSPVGVDVFNFPQERTNGTYQFADTVRSVFDAHGSHSLAFGADIRRTSLDSDLPRNSRPLLTFFGGQCIDVTTFCPQTAGFAQPLDFVASGAATGSFQSLVSPGNDAKIRLSYYQLDFFAQDEWRPIRNLTLNFGLRYELNTTPKEADRKIENTFSAPLPPELSGLSQFIDGRTSIYDSDNNNFAPRLGFAYAPTRSTVIRGGFGMYYDQILGAVVSQSRNVFPTFRTVNFGGGVIADNFIGNDPVLTLFNPRDAIFDPSNSFVCSYADFLAGTAIPCDAPVGQGGDSIFLITPGTLNTLNAALSQAQLNAAFKDIGTLFPGALFGTTLPTRELDTPFSYQYSLGVEHELFRDTFISVAYVGTTGRDLLRFTTPNRGTNFVTKINGFFFDTLTCAQNTSLCVPLTKGTTNIPPRPVANAGAISQYETTGRSQYNSLQIELRGRWTRRFQYRTNYVYGKANDDVSDVFDLAGAFALPQNSVTFAGEYAPANFDVRHRFTYSFLLDTPELRDMNDVVKFLLGGWQVAGTGKFNTGQPYTVNTIFDINQDGNLTDRLNNTQFITETGDGRQPLVVAANANLTQMLAPFGQDGDVPRNTFRTGKLLELDMSFAKKFAFRETQTVEFRADIFNFINRANFGVPVRFLEAPGFGQAVETITPARRIQFMLRYLF